MFRPLLGHLQALW